MYKIGITGGIGSGKSIVAEIFKTLGIPVFNADEVGRMITNENPEVLNLIKTEFGSELVKDNRLDRKKLASIVFNDKNALKRLNTIIHPAVGKAYEEWVNSLKGVPYCLKETAILFESGSNKNLDKVIVVTAPEELRIKRVVARDKTDKESVRSRMKMQMKQKELLSKADYVINNDEKQLLIPQILEIHQKLTLL